MKTSAVVVLVGALFISSLGSAAFADVPQRSPGFSGSDEELGLKDSEVIQDLDAQPSADTRQLYEALRQKIETAQAMNAGDEEVAESVHDEF